MEGYNRGEDSIETTKLLAEDEERGGGVDEPDRESFVSYILVKLYSSCIS